MVMSETITLSYASVPFVTGIPKNMIVSTLITGNQNHST